MYTVAEATVTLPNNKTDAFTIYEPLKDDESSNVHGAQAAYEVPDISGAQCYNDTLVRSRPFEHFSSLVLIFFFLSQMHMKIRKVHVMTIPLLINRSV